jgi:hypothetical protein
MAATSRKGVGDGDGSAAAQGPPSLASPPTAR